MAKGFLDQPLEVGDLVIWPVQGGHQVWMEYGIVQEILPSGNVRVAVKSRQYVAHFDEWQDCAASKVLRRVDNLFPITNTDAETEEGPHRLRFMFERPAMRCGGGG